MENKSQYLTTKEVAERLGISVTTCRAWLQSGKLPSVKIGRRWMVPAQELEETLKPTGGKQ